MVKLRGYGVLFHVVAILLNLVAVSQAADWKIADGPLLTKWAKDVSPDKALPEYPRPQMVRKDWLNLNGLWQFDKAEEKDEPEFGRDLPERILVPYPVESALSGLRRHEERMWYRRTFEIPKEWSGKHVLLHFGAVDWEATVFLNGKKLGVHRGGYDGFDFDITDSLKAGGTQELIVGVWDPTNDGSQPRGKQVLKPGGIFYTPTSGIWQTVWIEPVSATHIESLAIVPDLDNNTVHLTVNASGEKTKAHVELLDGDQKIADAEGDGGTSIDIPIKGAKTWTPDAPFLYRVRVKSRDDEVESYFGMRKISLGKDDKGVTRLMLNNQFVFQVGPLDQGFWPDGIYTAPTDEALKWDIETTKRLGFNMTRKHVKVEPERWYYWADKLGLLVWQDMPAGDNKTAESKTQFEVELSRLIEGRINHPSIVMWVVFNEGWGEFDVPRLTDAVRKLDPSRLIDNASGWTDMKVGDVIDMHHYPDPASPKPEENRAAVLGEFGGLGLALPPHTWSKESWGYRGVGGQDALTASYTRMLGTAHDLKDSAGLSAVVYTQITDVETECNGLITYDRQIIKVDPDRAHAANTGHGPRALTLLATSQREPAVWRYTIDKPADGWIQPDFDDASWKQGPAGFGTEGTPGAIVRTTWKTDDIWIRRDFELKEPIEHPLLLLHHDDDAEVYLNGVLALSVPGYVSSYEMFPITDKAAKSLKAGKNSIAIHCRQHAGGQYIDAGIVEMK